MINRRLADRCSRQADGGGGPSFDGNLLPRRKTASCPSLPLSLSSGKALSPPPFTILPLNAQHQHRIVDSETSSKWNRFPSPIDQISSCFPTRSAKKRWLLRRSLTQSISSVGGAPCNVSRLLLSVAPSIPLFCAMLLAAQVGSMGADGRVSLGAILRNDV